MTSTLRACIASIARHRWLWCLGVLIWAVVLFNLSSRSTLPKGPDIPYQDKVLHFLYFSGGGFCFALAFFYRQVPQKPRWVWWLAGTAFGICVGALDEFHQTFTPGRSGNDLGDLLADLTGAGAGALVAWTLLAWFRRAEKRG
ncbi:MAG: VanZ family protein [Prosthecobacter sp.]|nr:VanZ family protein [Prosthecobacter sp.]